MFFFILILVVYTNAMPINYISYCQDNFKKCSTIDEIIIASNDCNKTTFIDLISKDKINNTVSNDYIKDLMKVENCSKVWVYTNRSYIVLSLNISNNKQTKNSGQSKNINMFISIFMLQLFLYY
jgi:hypothetical protein